MREIVARSVGYCFLLCVAFALAPWLAPAHAPPLAASRLLSGPGPTFEVANSDLSKTPTLVVYGDMRFTDPSDTKDANPQARKLLAEKVASLHPDALELIGDLPYKGGNLADYDEFRAETLAWRAGKLRVYPALGNHEFVGDTEQCLKNWWEAFPELQNRRWYSVQFGTRMYLIDLDSNSDLLADSEQMRWLQDQVEHLPQSVDFVFIALHHPPVADKQTLGVADHSPRPNEVALRDYLSRFAPQAHARFVVVAGHIHNYERFEVGGVTYLVSGGGGARPYEVEREPEDRYQSADRVNFHYLLFRLVHKQLHATMYRLPDPAAEKPEWQPRDTFLMTAR